MDGRCNKAFILRVIAPIFYVTIDFITLLLKLVKI